MCLFQMFAFMCVSAESVRSRGGKIRGGGRGGEKNAPSYLVAALPLMWEELEVMRRKNVMSFDVLWNISCLFLFKQGRFSQYGAARMSHKLLLIVVPTDDHRDFLFLTKPKNSNHSNRELESTNTAEKKLSEITIRLSCKVS